MGSINLKALLGIFLTLGLVFASLPAVAAQDAEAPTLPGFGDAITWTDESGEAIASATVHGVENDFRDYDEGWNPEYGYSYTLVDVSAVNDSDKSIILQPHTFLLVDDHGGRYNRLNLTSAGVDTFDDDIALAPGESAEFSIAYSIPTHANAALFAWNPEQGQMRYVVLSTDVSETSAIAWGMENSSTFTDAFVNPVATLQVTNINHNWEGYDEFSAPNDDEYYVAVDFAITNQTERSVEIDHFDFTLANTDGTTARTARVTLEDDGEAPFRDSVHLEAGESMEMTMVFAVPTGTEPIIVMWEPTFAVANMVVIAQPPAAPVEATPAAN